MSTKMIMVIVGIVFVLTLGAVIFGLGDLGLNIVADQGNALTELQQNTLDALPDQDSGAGSGSANTDQGSGSVDGSTSMTISQSVLDEDFEDDDFTSWFNAKTPSADQEGLWGLSSSQKKGGISALKVKFPNNRHDGMGARFEPKKTEDFDSNPKELYASYWVYFPEDFVSANGEGKKLPGPVNYFEDWSQTNGNGDGHGGDPSKGYGWSARTTFKDDTDTEIELGMYVYHMDMKGRYGDNWGVKKVPKGKWHKIEQYVKLNTVSDGTANDDGVLRMWINGEENVNRQNVRWTNHPKEGIKYEWIIWYGGNTPSPTDQAVYLDNLKIGLP